MTIYCARQPSQWFARLLTGAIILFSPLPALAEPASCQPLDNGMQHISRAHDRLRFARQRECLTLLEVYDDKIYPGWIDFKNSIDDKIGLSFSMDASLTGQWGIGGAGPGSGQGLFSPSASWSLFDHSPIGSGELQFFYVYSQYISGNTASNVQAGLNLNTPINDYPGNSTLFAQLSYTHTLPGDWLAVTFGQFPIFNFDGNPYSANQQANFLNYSMAQNGSATYPIASFGGYAQLNPTKTLAIIGGFQDANNVTGSGINLNTFGEGVYNWFLSASWTPTIDRLGASQISFLYYNQPAVPAQPQATTGWSINLSQAIGKTWGAFLRANQASSGSTWNIRSSVAFGGVLNDPLGRNPIDQTGLGIAFNGVNQAVYPDQQVRGTETVIEGYWAWTLVKGFQLTPDVQLTLNPALDPEADAVVVVSIRALAMF